MQSPDGTTVSLLVLSVLGLCISLAVCNNNTIPAAPTSMTPACTLVYGQTSKCIYRGVTQIPRDIPDNTRILVIKDGSVDRLEKDALEKLTDLQNLTIESSKLTTIEKGAFKKLTLLIQVDLRYNELTSVENGTFPYLPYLRHIDLSYNRISAITKGAFTSLVNLKDLHLEGNKLASLPSGIFHGLNLYTLNLQQNLIANVENAFTECTINKLYLQNNIIRSLEDKVFLPLATSVTVLDLSNNPLQSVPMGIMKLSYLQSLSLSNVKITHFPKGFLANLKKLSHLDISSNKLTSIDILTVKEFYRMNRIELFDNQWKCDCGIKPLRDWLNRASEKDQMCANMTDFAEMAQLGCLLCMKPEHLVGKAITSIKGLDENCSGVETTSMITLDQRVGIIAAAVVVVIIITAVTIYCIKQRIAKKKEKYNVSVSREVLSTPVNGSTRPTEESGDHVDNGGIYTISQTLRRASSIESSI